MKVKGFTLLEAMVSILLSTLLVGFTFTIYKNFNQYYLIYNSQTNRLNELLHFKRQFNKDWNSALTIKSPSKTEIQFSNNLETIEYQFEDSTIVRIANTIQTFNLIPKTREFENNSDDKVTKLSLELISNRQKFVFSHFKSYGIKNEVENNLNISFQK